MALNVVLVCLVAVSMLNLLLVYDLYGRSARLAEYASLLNEHGRKLAYIVTTLTSRSNP